MDPMKIFELLIGIACTFGIGLCIYFFGVYAGKKTDKPMGFWANGEPLDPKKVTDIASYNQEYGKLFRQFAVLPMISGVFTVMSVFHDAFAYVYLFVLLFWGTFGMWWLIRSYKKIEKRYILR